MPRDLGRFKVRNSAPVNNCFSSHGKGFMWGLRPGHGLTLI